MALSDILEKIREDSKGELEALEQEWQSFKKAEEDKFALYEEDFLKKAETKAASEGARHRERLITRAESDRAMKILQKKRELLDRVFQEAEEKLRKRSNKAELWAKIFEEIPEKKGKLILPQEYLEDLGKKIKKSHPDIELEATKAFKEGFVLESGRISYDNRLKSLMEQAKELFQDEMVDFLFGEE